MIHYAAPVLMCKIFQEFLVAETFWFERSEEDDIRLIFSLVL